MPEQRPEQRSGLSYLESVTALLCRVRNAHPTKGLYEAADMQWWWRTPRPTDTIGQLFWFDDTGQPEAAIILTQWSNRVALDPMLMPDASDEFVAHVIETGLKHAGEQGFDEIELEVSQGDVVMREVLRSHGFALSDEGFIAEAWIEAKARPAVSPLHDDYRLLTRSDRVGLPHHLIRRSGPDVAERLLQTSLYNPELDLLIVDQNDGHAAHGVFWYDPETRNGMVEPMRTEDDHQRKGLAGHILTTGLDCLAQAGAERIKISYEPDNAAASHLYLSVGFEPVKLTDAFSGLAISNTPGSATAVTGRDR